MTEPGYSVYGLRVTGLPAGLPLMAGGEDGAQVRIVNGATPLAGIERRVTAEGAAIPMSEGRTLVLDRPAGEARFHGQPLPPETLVHPYLGPVGTIWNRWLGAECFHAGAFVAGGRAWAVRGGREAGKSALLAAMAERDVPVLADDIVVVKDGEVSIGPRCIDLRAALPGCAGDLSPSRDGSRLRMRLPPAPAAVPLGGWVFLEWGDELSVERLHPGDVLRRVISGRAWGALPSDAEALLSVGTRPGWRFVRPQRWVTLGAAADRLLSLATHAPPATPAARAWR